MEELAIYKELRLLQDKLQGRGDHLDAIMIYNATKEIQRLEHEAITLKEKDLEFLIEIKDRFSRNKTEYAEAIMNDWIIELKK